MRTLCWILLGIGAGALPIPLGLDSYMPIPEDNPLTPKKVALGRELFHDPRLSRDGSVSCATCHDPKRGFTDDRAASIGVFGRQGNRRVPRILNRGYGKAFFWDGRVASLEEQVLQPIQNAKEMDMTLEEVVGRLKSVARYRELFEEALQHGPNARDLSRALASYVRTILAADSPYDRFVNGNEAALAEEARLGLRVFQGKGNCTFCHLGPNLTDESFHNTGIAWRDGSYTDEGRYSITRNEKDHGAFKTPTLREVGRTGPYMHDGSLATLDDVVAYYARGGNRNPHLDPEIRPLNLTAEEKRALVAFLLSLSGSIREGM